MVDYVDFARVRELPEFPLVDTVYFVQPNAGDPVRQFITGDDAVPVEIAAATVAQQLFDAGLIDAPTVAAMSAYLTGPIGATPAVSIDPVVQTVPNGTPGRVVVSGTPEAPELAFTLPAGPAGASQFTDSEVAALRALIAAPTLKITPTQFTDSAETVSRGSYYETSALARTLATTSATSLTVTAFTNLYGEFSYNWSEIGVYSNGVWVGQVPASANGSFSGTIALPEGPNKQIQLVNGLKARPGGGAVKGTYLVSVEGNAPIAQTFPTPLAVTAFIGDSILVGANATHPAQLSLLPRYRANTTDSLVAIGYGSNTLDETAGTSTLRTALVAKLVAASVTKIVIILGTNDYGLSRTNAATFGASYGALADAIHAALPSVPIIAVTPLLRGTETSIGGGDPLSAYRSAVSTAASGKSWVTVVNGATLVTLADLDEPSPNQLHPTGVGFGRLAANLGPFVGYTLPAPPVGTNPLNAADANSTISTPSTGVTRATKSGGGSGFNCGVYAPIRTGDFRYQIDIAAYQDTMIGICASPQADSGFADMIHQIYLVGSGNIQDYTGNTAGSFVGTYNPGFPNTRFWIDRTGSTVTFRQGNDATNTYANSVAIATTSGVTGSVALDFSLFTVGSYIDVVMIS